MTITAKIIADSISTNGERITTMELEYPRLFIHSQFMTHRMFSRNSSSSRAIPIEKMIKQVEENTAMPIHWGKNQPGMQAREEVTNVGLAQDIWGFSAVDAISNAEELSMCGLHKQIVNRLLEPFLHIRVIVTATEYDNFFTLRCHADAQPEMQELARCMLKAMDVSTPELLENGQWHMPYVDALSFGGGLENAIKCSVARCARVSYLNHDNSNPDIEKDIALADKLLEAGHMSPFEHQATPMEITEQTSYGYQFPEIKGYTHMDKNYQFWSGNFRGWIQYRQTL